MRIKNLLTKILAVLAACGAFLSTVFFLMFKSKTAELKKQKSETEKEKAEYAADSERKAHEMEKAVMEKQAEIKKEDAELEKKSHSGNNLNSFNAGIELLRKQSERGNKRNSGPDNCGT